MPPLALIQSSHRSYPCLVSAPSLDSWPVCDRAVPITMVSPVAAPPADAAEPPPPPPPQPAASRPHPASTTTHLIACLPSVRALRSVRKRGQYRLLTTVVQERGRRLHRSHH